jgi:hypothetical protein
MKDPVHPPKPELTLADFAYRSLLPLATVVLLALTPWITAYGFAVAALLWWRLVQRMG